jgi:hypothetical protein
VIRSRFILECNKCLEVFEHNGISEFDLALESYSDVRNLARQKGWTINRRTQSDTCPLCLCKVRASKAAV